MLRSSTILPKTAGYSVKVWNLRENWFLAAGELGYEKVLRGLHTGNFEQNEILVFYFLTNLS